MIEAIGTDGTNQSQGLRLYSLSKLIEGLGLFEV